MLTQVKDININSLTSKIKAVKSNKKRIHILKNGKKKLETESEKISEGIKKRYRQFN